MKLLKNSLWLSFLAISPLMCMQAQENSVQKESIDNIVNSSQSVDEAIRRFKNFIKKDPKHAQAADKFYTPTFLTKVTAKFNISLTEVAKKLKTDAAQRIIEREKALEQPWQGPVKYKLNKD